MMARWIAAAEIARAFKGQSGSLPFKDADTTAA
jgi:hypothetical protein